MLLDFVIINLNKINTQFCSNVNSHIKYSNLFNSLEFDSYIQLSNNQLFLSCCVILGSIYLIEKPLYSSVIIYSVLFQI